MIFGIPAVMLLISVFIFRAKVILSEQKHAEIVDQLEKTWGKKIKNVTPVSNEINVVSPILVSWLSYVM